MKMPVITNVWSKVIGNNGEFFSTAVVESTADFVFNVNKQGNNIIVEGKACLNLPEDVVKVKDGLLQEICLSQPESGVFLVELRLEHPARFQTEVVQGIPVRTIISVDRSFLKELFTDKKIIIDPGHGGNDQGYKGPVNLLEKNVVIPIALNLQGLFQQVGVKATLTRRNDEDVLPRRRIYLARKETPDLFLSIHTHFCRNPGICGSVVLYNPFSEKSRVLALLVLAELAGMLKVTARGIGEAPELKLLGDVPAVLIEVVTISNWVEEGLLRSPTVHQKAAQGIFNGVKKYFALGSGESS